MASDDPEFETKAAGIIGLYLNPPQHQKDDEVLTCVAGGGLAMDDGPWWCRSVLR